MSGRSALGAQGIHIVKQAADRLQDDGPATATVVGEILKVSGDPEPETGPERRNRLRAKVDAASVRPTPGTSDLLARPLRATTAYGFTDTGKLGEVETHDLTALAPIHLYVAAEEEGLLWIVRKTIRQTIR